jgi:hypothetical protein
MALSYDQARQLLKVCGKGIDQVEVMADMLTRLAGEWGYLQSKCRASAELNQSFY